VQFYEKYPELDTIPEGKNISWNKIVTKYLPDKSPGQDAIPSIDKALILQDKWGVEPGQVWILGNHRLVCGNSQDPATLGLALDGNQPDLMINDPPYGMELDTDYSKMPSTKPEGNKIYSPIVGDDKPFNYGSVILRCNEEFWFGADYYHRSLPDGGSWLVWDKRVDENFDAMIGSAFELIWSKKQHKREIIRHNNTLFSGEAEAKNKLHPTIKPAKVIEWIVERYSNPGGIIADLYAGAGTTIIACENKKRRCIAIEIEPKYVAVTLDRWVSAFGIEPILEN
jgi:DNA modification methylase